MKKTILIPTKKIFVASFLSPEYVPFVEYKVIKVDIGKNYNSTNINKVVKKSKNKFA